MGESRRDRRCGSATCPGWVARSGSTGRSWRTLYVGSKGTANAETFVWAAHRPWRVENRLHWVLDVRFRDDERRVRKRTIYHRPCWPCASSPCPCCATASSTQTQPAEPPAGCQRADGGLLRSTPKFPEKSGDGFRLLHLDGFRHFHEFRNLVEVHVAIDFGGLGVDQLDLLHVFRDRDDAAGQRAHGGQFGGTEVDAGVDA